MRHGKLGLFESVLGTLLAAALAFSPTQAAESAPHPVLEKAAALDGYNATVLGHMFLGPDNTSYLRFLNLSGAQANVSVSLVGSPSGHLYGTTTVGVANHASKQVAVTDLMAAANVAALSGDDDRLSVYLRADGAPVTVQHVLFNGATGFFENMTTCQNSAVSDANAALMNVHTTAIDGYTSFISLYNYAPTEESYDIPIYEAGTGVFKGQVTVPVAGNSAFEKPFSWFQDQIQWTPGPSEYNANIMALAQSGARSAQVTHTVYNNRLGVYLNLTAFCSIPSTTGALPTANNDTLAGATAGLAFPIPSSMILGNDLNTSGAAVVDVSAPMTNGSVNGGVVQTGNELVLVAARAGIVTFQYRLKVGTTTSNFATVTVNVSDGGPIANSDRLTLSFTAGNTTAIPLAALTNNDRNTTNVRLINVTSPRTNDATNGALVLTSDGLAYTPARPGTVIFRYQLQNAAGTLSNEAVVTLTVGGTGAPTAVGDTLTLSFVAGQATTIPVSLLTGNDLNADGAIFQNVSTPVTDGTSNGSIARSADSVIYTPARAGTATFTYQLSNAIGVSNTGTVTLTVLPANSAPIAESDTLGLTFAVGVQTTIPFSVLIANDKAASGATLESFTAPSTDGTANGAVTRIGNDLTYVPARVGIVTFSYTIRTSNGVSNAAVVRFIVQ